MGHPRILVLRGGAIGDFILTLPALQMLRDRWPDAHIQLVGYPHVTALAVAAGLADGTLSLHSADIARLFAEGVALPDEQREFIRSFDLIVNYFYDPSATVHENLLSAGAPQVIYGCPLVREEHAVEHLLRPLEALALYPEGEMTPMLCLPEDNLRAGRQRGVEIGEHVVLIHPGSGSARKNWSLDGYLEVARRLSDTTDFSPAILLGEADAEVAEQMATRDVPAPVVQDLNLVEVAELLSACEGYIGNDSGVTHLAAAMGAPVLAIFGPTNPALWGPRGNNVEVIGCGEGEDAVDITGLAVERVWVALHGRFAGRGLST